MYMKYVSKYQVLLNIKFQELFKEILLFTQPTSLPDESICCDVRVCLCLFVPSMHRLVLLSAQVKRLCVSRIRFFFFYYILFNGDLQTNSEDDFLVWLFTLVLYFISAFTIFPSELAVVRNKGKDKKKVYLALSK